MAKTPERRLRYDTRGHVTSSYGLGGAVVHRGVLVRQGLVGGACGHRPMGALLPGPQEAVGEDGQQRQDGHRQQHRQRDLPWGERGGVVRSLPVS